MAQRSLEELNEELERLRPPCARWGTKSGCRHGRHCKFAHSDTKQNPQRLLPHTCRHLDKETGLEYLVVRPPLKEALEDAFMLQRCDFFQMLLGMLGSSPPVVQSICFWTSVVWLFLPWI
jgi:hypothetical protein